MQSAIAARIPQAAVVGLFTLLDEYPILIKVVKNRTSKAGDFRAPTKVQPARITVNGNLNSFAFLITLLHEMAHYMAWINHDKTVRKFSFRSKPRLLPHGKEWKDHFHKLMLPFVAPEVFPADILPVLIQYLENPKASSSADHHLSKVLKKHDPPDPAIRLEELPLDAIFTIHGKRSFRKKEKIRTRYRCICLKTNRIYLVSAGAPVIQEF